MNNREMAEEIAEILFRSALQFRADEPLSAPVKIKLSLGEEIIISPIASGKEWESALPNGEKAIYSVQLLQQQEAITKTAIIEDILVFLM